MIKLPHSTSDAVTEGFRVTVTSHYLPEQSRPVDRRYFWAYTVRIENHSSVTAQLVTRHWVITDSAGHVEEIRGPGVVGKTPVLRPSGSFQYTSGCPLPTSCGMMHGTYQMVRDDGSEFDLEVAPFGLLLPTSLN